MVFSVCGPSCSPAVTKSPVPTESIIGTSFEQQQEAIAKKGWAKIQENDCPSCHALERRSVGPAYTAIATKYQDNKVALGVLADRIINGSVGVWGEIPMPAHPEISKEEAEQMATFVFSLKN
ncbi:MAG TPA: c-type cytochrome [Cyclobacteriaceae bacterium]|nr:c-type cytochrome [Cyclobacteriaceae bacterium]